MAKHTKTPVVKFWGFNQNPFRDAPLRSNSLSLFTCREEEIADLKDSLDNPLTGVYGSLGVGKTSFLNKAAQILSQGKDYNVVYVDLGHCTEANLYREFLRVLLERNREKTFKLRRGSGINIKKELERLDSTLTASTTSKIGASAVLVADRSEESTKEINIHSEETARSKISEIVQKVNAPLVVLVDDLEKVKYFLSDQATAYLRAIASFTSTFKDIENDLVSFVITLDDHFARLVEEERKAGSGAFSYSFGELLELRNFNPKELAEVIKIRLQTSDWCAQLGDFISLHAFWLLVAATSGHPRKALAVLREAMKFVHRHGLPKIINIESMMHGMSKTHYTLNEFDIAIISYLQKSGGASPSDEEFQRSVNLTRRSLSERLKVLLPKVNLNITMASATSGKQEYSLPPIPLE